MTMKLDVRLLAPGPERGSLLLADGRLPAVVLEQDQDGPAIGLVRAWLDRLAFPVPVLETHPRWTDLPDGEAVPTIVWTEAVDDDWPAPAGWVIAELAAGEGVLDGLPAAILPRARELLAELRSGGPPPALRPRWARPGWFARASTWMATALADVGRPLLAAPEPFFLRGISALLRGRTAGGDVYLKAVFPPFHAEPAITQLLAERFPATVPRVLATQPDEGWLLLEGITAPWIGELPEAEKAPAMAVGVGALVRLQRELGDDVGELVLAGAPERPLDDLAEAFDRATGPAGMALDEPLDDARRTLAQGAISAAVRRVASLGFPTSLVHGDFHPGNAALAGDDAVIIDWSDAAIGSPIIDLVTWLAWSEDQPAERAAAIDGWIAAWAGPTDPSVVRERLDDVLLLGAAYQVVSYDGILAALEPATRYTMAGAASHYLKQMEDAMRRLAGAAPGTAR
jgi:hypothetical protein